MTLCVLRNIMQIKPKEIVHEKNGLSPASLKILKNVVPGVYVCLGVCAYFVCACVYVCVSVCVCVCVVCVMLLLLFHLSLLQAHLAIPCRAALISGMRDALPTNSTSTSTLPLLRRPLKTSM